jgi:hypothetical protein
LQFANSASRLSLEKPVKGLLAVEKKVIKLKIKYTCH